MIESLTLLIAFGAILGGVVLVHELGHFAAARACAVRIKELGFGLPPRLARLGSLGGAEISLNWIPLGGFVRPAGEFDASVPDGLAAGAPVVLEIERGAQVIETSIRPRTDPPEGRGPAGFTSSGVLIRYELVPALGRASMKVPSCSLPQYGSPPTR